MELFKNLTRPTHVSRILHSLITHPFILYGPCFHPRKLVIVDEDLQPLVKCDFPAQLEKLGIAQAAEKDFVSAQYALDWRHCMSTTPLMRSWHNSSVRQNRSKPYIG